MTMQIIEIPYTGIMAYGHINIVYRYRYIVHSSTDTHVVYDSMLLDGTRGRVLHVVLISRLQYQYTCIAIPVHVGSMLCTMYMYVLTIPVHVYCNTCMAIPVPVLEYQSMAIPVVWAYRYRY